MPPRTALRRFAVLLSAGLLALAPMSARAGGDADEADLHFKIAAERYAKGEFRDALEHFLASNRLVPNVKVVFNIARTFEQLGQFADAHRYYTEALAGESDPARIAAIKAAIQKIAPKVAVLRVESNPPGATIYVGRKDLGSQGKAPRALAVPPGQYQVIAELEGYETQVSAVVDAKLGGETVVPITLTRITGAVVVSVTGAPGAVVHIDDEKSPAACTAPCKIDLSPGLHTLYFEREGFQAPPRQINVVARGEAKVTGALAPITGSLLVSADERDAIVEIDGQKRGFTPTPSLVVPVGLRKIKVTLRGYVPVEREVEIKSGEQSELLDLKMVPLRQVSAVSRYAESIDDAPSSVTIIDGQEIRAFGYPTIAESLRGVRGIYLSNDRAYVSAGIRGIGQPNDYGNRLLVLSDGMSLNDNLLSSSYIGSDGRADLHDIDRIEVVRGPGSLLYGTGAFSGVVNLVPKGKDEPNGVHVGVGTYDNGVARGRAGFHYNFTPETGLWASVSGARSDGISVPMTLTETGKKVTVNNVDQFKSIGTAGRFWAGPLTIQWFYHDRDQNIPVGIFQTKLNDSRTDYHDTRYLAEIRYEPKLGDQVQLFTRAYGNHYGFNGFFAYETNGKIDPSIEDYQGTWAGGEARIVYSPVKEVRITAGGEGQGDPEARINGYDQSDPKHPYVDVSKPYGFGAGYLLAETTPTKWFHASAGARVDHYSTFGTIFVPRAAVIFHTSYGDTIKLMGGRAFRAPSLYEQYYQDGTTQAPGLQPGRGITLGPESVYSGELEYSRRFAEDWVALAAGHVSYIQNLIQTVSDCTGPNATATCGDFVRYANSSNAAITGGGDVEIRREWRQGWMLSATYGYQFAQFVDQSKGDARIVNAPEHLASFKGVVPILPDLVSLALRVTLEAPRRIDLANSDTTDTTVVGDLVLSGTAKKFGVYYALGLYNFANSTYAYPVTDKYLSRTAVQNGRTVLADIKVTYP